MSAASPSAHDAIAANGGRAPDGGTAADDAGATGAGVASAAPALAVEGIEQYHGSSHTLRDVSLGIERGCTVLMGRNGVGKTTLLQCVVGLLPIRAGRVALRGEDITALAPERRAAAGVGYVPQGRQIFPRLTVEENLRVGLRARRDGRREVPEEIHDLFPMLADMRRRRGGDLSGGQQQQLAIGRALATGPDVLLLDEPTEGIQPNVVAEIGEVIGRLHRELGLAVLIVEQKLPFARRIGDRFALMDRGAIVAEGSMDTLGEDLVGRYLTV